MSGGGTSDETGPPPDEVPVNVIFGEVIGPVAEAESRGLAAPAPVNVIFGEVIGPVAKAGSRGTRGARAGERHLRRRDRARGGRRISGLPHPLR